MKKKLKVLTFGDNAKTSSGYGQVWDNLLKRFVKLRPDWEFLHVAWQSKERPHKTAAGYTKLPSGTRQYGVDIILSTIMEHKPDIVLVLVDVGWQLPWVEAVFEARRKGWKGKYINWTPVDTHSWDYERWDTILDSADLSVAMSKKGLEMMKGRGLKRITYIPHGIDLKEFVPLSKEERDKARLNHNIRDKFCCGFVGRNQRRKMIQYLLKGFARFAKGKEDVRLLLHTDSKPQQEMLGFDVNALVGKYTVEYDQTLTSSRKIIMTKDDLNWYTRQKVSPKGMNDIYNLMDLFLYPTGGEGFGIPGIECQASGVPLMMTNYTTGPELSNEGKPIPMIPVLKDQYGNDVVEIGQNGVENAVPDDEAMAKLLEDIYKKWHKDKLVKERKQARTFAEGYNYDDIALTWLQQIEIQAENL